MGLRLVEDVGICLRGWLGTVTEGVERGLADIVNVCAQRSFGATVWKDLHAGVTNVSLGL